MICQIAGCASTSEWCAGPHCAEPLRIAQAPALRMRRAGNRALRNALLPCVLQGSACAYIMARSCHTCAQRVTSAEQFHTAQMEKWSNKEAFSTPVARTKFIAMKTPLSQLLLDKHFPCGQPCRHPNTISHLLAHCKQHGFELGLIINLAAHQCLYAADLQDGIPVEQIPLTAKVVPPRDAVQRVLDAADAFWHDHPEKYIAIHCDYGAPCAHCCRAACRTQCHTQQRHSARVCQFSVWSYHAYCSHALF